MYHYSICVRHKTVSELHVILHNVEVSYIENFLSSQSLSHHSNNLLVRLPLVVNIFAIKVKNLVKEQK